MKLSRKRRGYTLIELLFMISIAVILLSVNVGWIHQTMKFSSKMTQRQRHHQNLTRLAWELRDDVRQSQSLAMQDENCLVLRMNDDTNIDYKISGHSIEMERRTGETTIRRERYELSPNSIASWDVSELPDWVSLIVKRGREGLAEDPDRSARDNEVTAVDLHVRVSPNRWSTSTSEQDSEKSEKQE